jgi:hypothetical protein
VPMRFLTALDGSLPVLWLHMAQTICKKSVTQETRNVPAASIRSIRIWRTITAHCGVRLTKRKYEPVIIFGGCAFFDLDLCDEPTFVEVSQECISSYTMHDFERFETYRRSPTLPNPHLPLNNNGYNPSSPP